MLMSLEATLADIVARLHQGRFPDEQAVSPGHRLARASRVGLEPLKRHEADMKLGNACRNHA